MFNKEAEFEKEAEDNKPPYAFCTFDTKCELWKDGFQKGAEFGYNKANEWHKQDIDDIVWWKEVVPPKEIKEND